ncbi:MAG: ribosomal protein S18-alanine N-acetyltransferase [Pseudomonadota bacterium]
MRPASATDLAAIHLLDRQWSPVYASDDGYAALLEPPAVLLVAESDHSLSGFAALSVVLDEATLLNIAVKKNARRRGLASSLLDEAQVLLSAKGVHRMLLELRRSNSGARRLYERHGFAVDGVRSAYYPMADGQREDAVLMSKTLEGDRESA